MAEQLRRELREKRIQKIKESVVGLTRKLVSQFIRTVIYTIYIFCFAVMVSRQLQVGNTFEIGKSIDDYLDKIAFESSSKVGLQRLHRKVLF